MLQFFCGVMGCSVERRDDAIGLVQLRAGRALVDLVPVSGQLGRWPRATGPKAKAPRSTSPTPKATWWS